MKNKKDNSIVIITAIISFIIGISFLMCFLYYYNIKFTIVINVIIVLLVLTALLYIPFKIAKNKEELINELFILDISSKSNETEHIRITENNTLFKYTSVIKYYYVFPKLFSCISLKGKLWETPTYDISGKIQLTANERNNIIEEINQLNNDENSEILVNYKGNRKLVNSNDINKVFENYFINI